MKKTTGIFLAVSWNAQHQAAAKAAHLQAVLREYDEICLGVNLILDRGGENND